MLFKINTYRELERESENMNEMLKEISLTLLEEAQDIASNIDLDGNGEEICNQLDEINRLIEKAKTGISKID